MTYSMRKVHEAVEASRACAGVHVSEDLGHLKVIGVLGQPALQAWRDACERMPDWLAFTCRDEDDLKIEIGEAKSGDRLKLHLQFSSAAETPCIVTLEGWRSLLLLGGLEKTSSVRLAFIDHGFSTAACAISPWLSEEPAAGRSFDRSQAQPRRYVRCQSPEFMAPETIEHWVIKQAPTRECVAFLEWRKRALEMQIRALPSELYREDGEDVVGIAGQNSRRLKLDTASVDKLHFDVVQDVIRWVYLSGNDIDVRHTFLTMELAREWPRHGPDGAEVDFCLGLARRLPFAFEAAQLAYKAHVRSGSKETMKALADLRKSLSDEVQKVIQQTRDLSTSVWRDVAVTVGVTALRISSSSSTNGNNPLFGWALLILAVYVAISYLLNRYTSDRFVAMFEANKTAWRSKLYGFLDDDDYQSLYDGPLKAATREYRKSCSRNNVIVLFIVGCIVLFALSEFGWNLHLPRTYTTVVLP